MLHKFLIPNSHYVPDEKVKLLSPQHWAKTQIGSSIKHREGIGETTYAHKTILFWNKGENALDVHLGEYDNVASFYLASGFSKFNLFCQKAEINYEQNELNPMHIEDTQVISDKEDEVDHLVSKPQRTFWS